jgi:hypothetical protein
MQDRVRMVGMRRWFVHTRVDPTWASPGHPSPLSALPRPDLPGSPASGTARVPVPAGKRRAIRRVRRRPRCRVSASASAYLLSLRDATDEPSRQIAYATVSLLQSTCQALLDRPIPPLPRLTRVGQGPFPSGGGRAGWGEGQCWRTEVAQWPPPVSSPSGRGRGEGQAERLWCLECHSLRSDWASCQRRGEVVVTAPHHVGECHRCSTLAPNRR